MTCVTAGFESTIDVARPETPAGLSVFTLTSPGVACR